MEKFNSKKIVITVLSIFITLAIVISLIYKKHSNSKNTLSQSTLVSVLDNEPIGIETIDTTDRISRQLFALIHANLFIVNEKLQIEGYLADKFHHNANFTTWTISLRPNLKFNDGNSITSQTIKEQIDGILEPHLAMNSAAEKIPTIYNFLSKFKKINIINDLTFEIELSESNIDLPYHLSMFPIAMTKQQLNTSGPYHIENLSSSEILLTPNKNFPDNLYVKKPKKNLKFLIIRDETSRLLKFLSNEIDFAYNTFYAQKTSELKNNKDITTIEEEGLASNYLALNQKNIFLKDIRVRQAIAEAININEIIKYRLFGIGSTIFSVLPQNHPYYYEPSNKFIYNPQNAEKLLDEAGFNRKSEMKNYRFKLNFKTTANKDFKHLIEAIAHYLDQIGIEVNVIVLEPSKFWEDIKNGDFDLYTTRFQDTLDLSILSKTLNSKFIGSSNRISYSDKTLDNLFYQFEIEFDLNKRKTIFTEIQKRVYYNLPIIYLWNWNQIFQYNANIKKAKLSKTASTYIFTEIE